MAVAAKPQAPTTEIGTSSIFTYPAFGQLSAAAIIDPNERVPELMWPRSVRITYPWMRNDTQLSGLYRGTTLPIRRYVWGIDANGADPAIVEAVCAELGLEPIDQAWQAYQTGESSKPVPRSRNRFSFDHFQADALKACYLGHYFFEQVYDVTQDGPSNLNGGWFAHLRKLAPRAPWTISTIYTDRGGGLTGIRQLFQPMSSPPIPVTQLVAFPFDQEPGEWTGRSMFRSCYREWAIKNELLHIDLENHRKAGGILLNEAPEGATPAQMEALAQLAVQMQVGGGGAVPAGTNSVFIRGTGSDVIASINRHDESMAREFLMMFMALGTSSSGGNRALAGSFLDWFAVSQEAIAIWFRDIVNEHIVEDFIDVNWGDEDLVPRLVFRRPEAANPLDTLAQAVNQPAGAPATVNVQTQEGDVPVAATRANPDALVVDGDTRESILSAHAEYERWAGRGPATAGRPRTVRPSAATTAGPPMDTSTVPLPSRPLRRDPYPHEADAQVNFAQIDANWQAQAVSLVDQWKTQIRAPQITALIDAIAAAGGDLETLAGVTVDAAGATLLASHLRSMAGIGAAEAVGEATRQGLTSAATPALDVLHSELEARAAALAQLLASALSQAAANKAVQISGGSLAPADVAAQVGDYLNGLSDSYLQDQFGGALSAAQNGGRLAAMDENGASRFYASELLDTNTCPECAAVDGTEYASADAAAADYPAGGYRDCAGGPRCRGTVVAVYDEASPTGEGAA